MSRDPDRESLTAFPTLHQLRAALRAGEVVARHAGRPAAELGPAFLRAPTEAAFSARDLEIGAGLLRCPKPCGITGRHRAATAGR